MIAEMKEKFSQPIVPMKRSGSAAVKVSTIADADFE
jgi:hypothetical protein